MNLGCDFIQILVDGLLDVQVVVVDQVDVVLNALEGVHSFLHFPVAPMGLNAVGCSLLDDLIDWQLSPTSSPLVGFEAVLDPGHGSHSFEQPFEEQDHLLVFMHIDFPVVVKDIETNSDHDVDVWRLEYQEVLVLVLEHKLIDEWIFLETLQGFG